MRRCHSEVSPLSLFFSLSLSFSLSLRCFLFFDHRHCRCLSPIHRRIIPPKSHKSLILFISTPHKKGALFPLLGLCVQCSRRPRSYTSVCPAPRRRRQHLEPRFQGAAFVEDLCFFTLAALIILAGVFRRGGGTKERQENVFREDGEIAGPIVTCSIPKSY